MPSSIKASIKQRIAILIPEFTGNMLYNLVDRTADNISRYSQFYSEIGIDAKEQERINKLNSAQKIEGFVTAIENFILANSVDKIKSGENKGKPKSDNIGRQKLFDKMKLYIVKNPESIGAIETKTPEKEPEVKVQHNKQRNNKLKSAIENSFQRSKTQQAMDSMKLFGLTESTPPTIETEIKETPAKPAYVPRLNTAQTIYNTPVRTQPVMPPVENKKLTLSDLLDAESENLVPKIKKIKKEKKEKKQQTDSLVDEKEREVKLPEQEQSMLTGLSNRLSNLNYGAVIGMAASYAVLNNNKGMLKYLPILGATMGSHISDIVTSSGFTTMMNIFRKFGADPEEIIKDTRLPSYKKATRAVKFDPKKEDEPEPEQEGKHDGPPQNKPIEKNDIPSPIDAKFENLDKQSIPPKMSLRESVKKAAGKIVDNIITAVATPFLEALEFSDAEVYDIKGRPRRFDDQGEEINSILYRGEYLDGKAVAYDGEGNMIDYATGKRVYQSNILRDVNGVILEPFDDRTPDAPIADQVNSNNDADSKDYDERTPITNRFRDTIDRAERFARSSDSRNKLSAGVAVGAGLSKIAADAIFPNQETKSGSIKEDPIAYKQDKSDQNDVPTSPGLIRGAGILKPKFIVPSVNIFAKTEQEQFVDDMEFAMFDFVQDDSGGNDPDGTNPILRDQTISKGLRYQRSGVTVNSLYGRDIPNNPYNISKEMMNQLFLGESVLPQMKFLFSEEFYPQEFNLSEFEVNNYDVNNELTAIEMLSPYANFTNNQLLDQFIDTSILYGVVP
jgi:hypothetical protein